MTSTLIVVACIAFCTATVVICCKKAPLEEYDQEQIDRINRIIASAAHHRDQLAACYQEALEINGFEEGTFESDVMIGVIFDGDSYTMAVNDICRYRQLAGESEVGE